MAGWLDYALADFLLFSPSTYWRLFQQLNGAVWPAHIAIYGVLAGLVFAVASGWRQAGLAVGVALAVGWAIVAQLFFTSYYAPINFAVGWIIPFAWAQAAALIILTPGLRFEAPARLPWPPYGLVCLAIAYPLVGYFSGRPFAQGEVAGLAPDPTAILTLGLLGLAGRGWRRLALSVFPIVWLLLSAITLHAMEITFAWALLAIVAASVFSQIRRP